MMPKIPYKTAGKESIASEGELKKYMKFCLSDLYRKVSAQIRKELKMKQAASRLSLYKYYIPLIVDAISESITADPKKLGKAFTRLAEKHVAGEISALPEANDVPAEEPEEAIEVEEGGDAKARPVEAKAAEIVGRKKKTAGAGKKGQTTLDAVMKKVKKE